MSLPRRLMAQTAGATEASASRPAMAALWTHESLVHRLSFKADHFLRTKKITSANTTTAPTIPPISGQFKGGFIAKLAVMR